MTWQGSDRRQRLPSDWPKRRQHILKRDGYLCQINGDGCQLIATEVDHIKPGDYHGFANLQAVCHHCHKTKSAAEGTAARATIRARATRPTEQHPGTI